MMLIRVGERIINGELIETAEKSVDLPNQHGYKKTIVQLCMTNNPHANYLEFDGKEAEDLWKILDAEVTMRTPGSEG